MASRSSLQSSYKPIVCEDKMLSLECGFCGMAFWPASKGGFTLSSEAPEQECKSFCTNRCLTRFLFKAERKRRLFLFTKWKIPVKNCKLSAFPGKNCGMLAAIDEIVQPDGSASISVHDYCGMSHAALGSSLTALDQSVLLKNAALEKFEREVAKATAKVKKLYSDYNKSGRVSKL